MSNHNALLPARATDPQTSRDAAASINVTSLEGDVLAALSQCPDGDTTYGLAERMNMSLVTVSPRIRPLVRKGLVIDTGRKVKGSAGRKQTVWAVS